VIREALGDESGSSCESETASCDAGVFVGARALSQSVRAAHEGVAQ